MNFICHPTAVQKATDLFFLVGLFLWIIIVVGFWRRRER